MDDIATTSTVAATEHYSNVGDATSLTVVVSWHMFRLIQGGMAVTCSCLFDMMTTPESKYCRIGGQSYSSSERRYFAIGVLILVEHSLTNVVNSYLWSLNCVVVNVVSCTCGAIIERHKNIPPPLGSGKESSSRWFVWNFDVGTVVFFVTFDTMHPTIYPINI